MSFSEEEEEAAYERDEEDEVWNDQDDEWSDLFEQRIQDDRRKKPHAEHEDKQLEQFDIKHRFFDCLSMLLCSNIY